jgi:hypothetical protein
MSDYATDTCRSCSAPIIWALTRNLRPMPVDAKPVAGGSVQPFDNGGTSPVAEVLSVAKQFGKTGLRMPHHATCPQGAAWRRPKARAS